MAKEKIQDVYCHGFFGRRYDLNGAAIIDESNYTITIKLESGEIVSADFTDPKEKEKYRELWTNI